MKPEEILEMISDQSEAPVLDIKVDGKRFVLGCLGKNGKMKSQDLADELKVSTARIAVIINTLEKDNLVIREKDLIDKRITYITLTDEGRTLTKNMYSKMINTISSVMSRVGEEDLMTFIKVAKVIKEEVMKNESNI